MQQQGPVMVVAFRSDGRAIFAVAVGGFAVMNNHLHVLVRLDPDVAQAWSDEEVVRRWGRLFPPRDKSRNPISVTEQWVQWRRADTEWVAAARQRLQNLGWFMKCLKEPLSRLANRQDKVRGTFFEGRFKSAAVLDEEALLTIGALKTCLPDRSSPVTFVGWRDFFRNGRAPTAGGREWQVLASSNGRRSPGTL
jgi:hypothetical protein